MNDDEFLIKNCRGIVRRYALKEELDSKDLFRMLERLTELLGPFVGDEVDED